MAALVRSLWRAVTLEENMTQLNLSGRQSNSSQQKPAAEHEDGSIKNQTVGALGALAMFAAVIVIGSCSRSSKPVAVQQPVQPTAPVSAPAPTVPTPAPAPAPVVAKAKKHRAATLSYVNREYGLSFTFPRNYHLTNGSTTELTRKTGNETQVASVTTEPLPMNFVRPGGVALAAVEMPGNTYPGTDFKSGLFNVSVNPGMDAEACAQFASPEASTGTDASTPVKIEQVKFGTTEFHQVEDNSAMTKQANAKYYHAFSNGACYEFALGIATNDDSKVEEIKPVDREMVFARLEKILATVKLQPAAAPETQTSVPAVAATTPADSSTPAEHQAAAPNF
jgi:hypothetical protein